MSDRIFGIVMPILMTGFLIFMNRNGAVIPEVTAIAGMIIGFVSGNMFRYGTGPRTKLQFQSGPSGHCVHVEHHDRLHAVEPKIFFDLFRSHPDGSKSWVKSEAINLSHLPIRPKKASAAVIIVSVPDTIISRFTCTDMELTIGLTAAHQYTGFRSLACETVPFSALLPAQSNAENLATA
jgi:hypothetical protein